MNELARLYKRIGYIFKDETLVQTALSHRSVGSTNYERLEFLGDSLLNFVIAEAIFEQHPNLDEGSLSRLRASLVRGTTLAEIARELELSDYLKMGTGELRSGGFNRDSTLADVVESLLGATLLDADFSTARAMVLRLFAARLANVKPIDELKDPKTRLQELLQGNGLERPVYEVIKTEGQSHNPSFTVTCEVPGYKRKVQAVASSRRKAEQAAAETMLAHASEYIKPGQKEPL